MQCTIFFPLLKQRYERFANRHIAAKSIGFQYFEQMHDAVVILYSIGFFSVAVVIIFKSIVLYLPFHVVHITIANNSNQYYVDYYIYGYANENVCVCIFP